MPTSGDLKSGDFFPDQHSLPPPPRSSSPIRPLPPPPLSNFAGKLYLSGTSSGWILIQSDSRLYRSNKEGILFYLFATNITQENEARNRNTSKRSQMILEFWNIWSLNLSFLWANDPNFLLSGGFWSPVRESGRLPLYSGDSMIIRESWRIWKRS